MKILKRAVVAAAMTCLGASAAAEQLTHYDEPGVRYGREYLDQHFGERIDPFSGNLALQFTDIAIPGNGGPELKVLRTYDSNAAGNASSPFGRGWDIHFGRVRHIEGQACGAATAQSMTLEIPGASGQTLHRSNGVAGTTTSDYITTGFWKAQCSASGFIDVFSPAGVKYEMTEFDGPYWHVSRITDRHGNYLNISYVTNAATGRRVVSSVSASDGRQLTFTYVSSRLTSISGGGNTWNYTVSSAADGTGQLTSVAPPAGSQWSFTYNGNLGTAAGSFALNRITNPFGGVITYSYDHVNFLPGVAGWLPVSAVRSKIAGGATWQYAYSPSCGGSTYDVTTVTLPNNLGQEVYRHFGYCSVAAGEVWKMGLLYQKSNAEQTETLTWTSQAISAESTTRPGYNKWDPQISRPLLVSRAVSRDGRTYTTSYGSFDSYGNPGSITESGTRSRSRTLSYFNSASLWIVGLPGDESISGAGSINRSWNSPDSPYIWSKCISRRTGLGRSPRPPWE